MYQRRSFLLSLMFVRSQSLPESAIDFTHSRTSRQSPLVGSCFISLHHISNTPSRINSILHQLDRNCLHSHLAPLTMSSCAADSPSAADDAYSSPTPSSDILDTPSHSCPSSPLSQRSHDALLGGRERRAAPRVILRHRER